MNGDVMDTTKDYVEMCEKAHEIQAKWKSKFNKELGDFAYRRDLERVVTVFDGADGEYTASTDHIASHHPDINKCVWLPRQDQLQDMLKNVEPYRLFNRLSAFGETVTARTPEQLTLCYVVHEKYGKTWNGKEWIR